MAGWNRNDQDFEIVIGVIENLMRDTRRYFDSVVNLQNRNLVINLQRSLSLQNKEKLPGVLV